MHVKQIAQRLKAAGIQLNYRQRSAKTPVDLFERLVPSERRQKDVAEVIDTYLSSNPHDTKKLHTSYGILLQEIHALPAFDAQAEYTIQDTIEYKNHFPVLDLSLIHI